MNWLKIQKNNFKSSQPSELWHKVETKKINMNFTASEMYFLFLRKKMLKLDTIDRALYFIIVFQYTVGNLDDT